MRVNDTKSSIYRGLKSLPWRPSYLAAMWILCGELQSLYAAWIKAEAPLIGSTMDLAREVAIAGESPQAAGRASELAAAWRRGIAAREAEAPGAVLAALTTFKALAQEIAALSSPYYAASWAVPAAEDRWQDWDAPEPILMNQDREADDSSPTAQTLALFRRVVAEIAAMQGPEWDPVQIRAQIFEQQ
jgi:hypothetical protein